MINFTNPLFVREGFASISVNTKTQGLALFPYYLRENRSSSLYPAVTTNLRMNFRDKQFILTAGMYSSIVFGVFDMNGFF